MSTRRRFLTTLAHGAGATALVGCREPSTPTVGPVKAGAAPDCPATPPPGLPDGLEEDNFHVHNTAPLAVEAKRSALGVSVITPNSRFFVRNNLPRPSDAVLADREAWTLDVRGVRRPGQITLARLRQLGMETVAAVVQCSGNGRKFFEHGPSGSPWATGAAGCAFWTGVRVSTVLQHFGGVLDAAKFLTGTGGEPLPEGVSRDTVVVERSVPIEKGMKDCLLVWEMNGVPLPITHGGPLRLLVPGYFGCNQIKYIRRLGATEEETTAKIQRSGYRLRPIGEKGAASQPSMWRMPVKSWINGPGADGAPVLAGSTTFYGVALSGERGVARVEVSSDGGDTWSDARLVGPDLGPNAWRTFQFEVDLPAGAPVTLVSRATDVDGAEQPRSRAENHRGYGHNGWSDHALTVRAVGRRSETSPVRPAPAVDPAPGAAPTSAMRPRRTLTEAGQRGRTVFNETAKPTCGTCHSLADAGATGKVGPSLDALKPDAARVEAAVKGGVGTMPAYTSLSSEQAADVAAYVAEVTR